MIQSAQLFGHYLNRISLSILRKLIEDYLVKVKSKFVR